MSAIITWTCKPCGKRVEGLDVEEFMRLDNDHVCKVADQLRRASAYFRRRSPALQRVADWLDSCASQADAMTGPADFDVCDEPGSVKHALAVAEATPWEESR